MAAFHKLLLVAAALLVGLGLSEVVLRFIRPDLRALAESPYIENTWRIFSTPKTVRTFDTNLDTGARHSKIYNDLGLRQHRNFPVRKGPNTIRIGVFGDSFTEAYYLPAPAVFTEVGDYLLNTRSFSERRFEVLNFGVSSYGTDQSYLRYLEEGVGLDLDAVVYVYSGNDIRNNVANRLLQLDSQQHLRTVRPSAMPRWKRVVRRFALPYLIMEVSPALPGLSMFSSLAAVGGPMTMEERQRAQNDSAPFEEMYGNDHGSPRLDDALNLFRGIVRAFADESARRSQRFFVMIAPLGTSAPGSGLAKHELRLEMLLKSMDIEVLNVAELIRNQPRSFKSFFWQRDLHWNAEANKIAAMAMADHVSHWYDLSTPEQESTKASLATYYGSFPYDFGSYGLRGVPPRPRGRGVSVRQKDIAAIYTALDQLPEASKVATLSSRRNSYD